MDKQTDSRTGDKYPQYFIVHCPFRADAHKSGKGGRRGSRGGLWVKRRKKRKQRRRTVGEEE